MSGAPVILSVDTSYIAVGFILSQCDVENPRIRYFSRFGSITLNDREAQFSQPKLELYGLFRSVRALRLYLIGLRNLVVEVDAKYIKGMLSNPDLVSSATINRWILAIMMFHFDLVHVPGSFHGPDGLSRRKKQPGDQDETDDDSFDDWIDKVNRFLHMTSTVSFRRFEQPPITIYVSEAVEAGQNIREENAMEREEEEEEETYAIVPRTEAARKADERLEVVKEWHETLKRPEGMEDVEYGKFMRYCMEFSIALNKLWRKDHRAQVSSGSIETSIYTELSAQRCGTSWVLRYKCINIAKVLVALHGQ
jgi:hypothetical protein